MKAWAVLAAGLLAALGLAQPAKPATLERVVGVGVLEGMAVNPKGGSLVTVSARGSLLFWDLASRTIKSTLETGLTEPIEAIAYRPDGAAVAAAAGSRLVVWNAQTGKVAARYAFEDAEILSIEYSPTAQLLAVSTDDNNIRLFNAALAPVARLQGHEDYVGDLAFSPDGKLLASASDDERVFLWDVASRKVLARFSGHNDYVRVVAFSRDGKTLVSSGDDERLRFWSVSTRKALTSVETGGWVKEMVYSPSGKFIATLDDEDTVRVWDAASRKPLRTLRVSGKSIGYGPQDQLYTASHESVVHAWNPQGQESFQLQGHSTGFFALAADPSGQVYTGQFGLKGLQHWDTTAWQGHLLKGDAQISDLAFNPNTGEAYAAIADAEVQVWKDGAKTGSITLKEPGYYLALSNDSKLLAVVGEDDRVFLINLENGRLLHTFAAGGDTYAIAFAPDGESLAIGIEGSVGFWNLSDYKKTREIRTGDNTVYALRYSPDGSLLAIGVGSGAILVHTAKDGRRVALLEEHSDRINSLVFSQDGGWLLSASEDSSAILWSTTDYQAVQTLEGHQRRVVAAIFNKDEDKIYTASGDGTLRVWSFKK